MPVCPEIPAFPPYFCEGWFVRMWGLGIHRHSLWFLVKGKEIWLLPPDKNTEESSRPENDFFFPFLFFFCYYLSLPDWSALCSPSVWAAQKRLLRQRIGEGGRRSEKGLWIGGMVHGRKRCNGRSSVVLVCGSLRQITRSCGRSETLSLDAAVVNILAWFRS